VSTPRGRRACAARAQQGQPPRSGWAGGGLRSASQGVRSPRSSVRSRPGVGLDGGRRRRAASSARPTGSRQRTSAAAPACDGRRKRRRWRSSRRRVAKRAELRLALRRRWAFPCGTQRLARRDEQRAPAAPVEFVLWLSCSPTQPPSYRRAPSTAGFTLECRRS
jgi:hypothetical protein